ncbi:hypothetical protein Sango_2809300 [Sesamum angolense]|uniref:Retrotransposon gag domain-containing protein n=1 Tax=Sesamum angolense TaxID=2727404 RepID=A0AAE1T7L0_9LAMI|nr:hypothetical protein Sango_2809300 [Sesamum angolense]
MQTRSRAREVHGVGDAPEPQLNGADQAPPHELPLPREQSLLNGQTVQPREQVPSPCADSRPHGVLLKETMIQLTQEALLALIHDASTRAAAQAMAQFAAQHPINPPPPSPRRSRELSSAPEDEEQRQEEGVEDPYLAFVVAPPRRSPFSAAILAEALPAGVKVSNLSEYDGTGDLQEHLDKFHAKIDWYDLSDAAYCKVFRTTLSKRALAWFSQLPAGTISSLEQLTQRFLHHFSMNKRVPKTAAFLFTIRQRENEPLRDYMQRFVEAVHEVPHVNHELLASIIQQNLLPGRFKESIAGKPPSTMENLLMRSQKCIRIEESNASDPSLGVKRKYREEEKELKKKEERVIAVISGGPTGRDSANARKALGQATRGNHWQAPIQVYNVNSENQEEISFNSQDMDPMRNQNNDALVISATLANFLVKKVLVDSGSSADIMFYEAYVQLGIDNAQLRKVNTPLTSFSGEMIEPLGEVMLPLSLGSLRRGLQKWLSFSWLSSVRLQHYLGETEFKFFRAIASTFHMKLKFPTSVGVGEAVGDELMARVCCVNTLKRSRKNQRSTSRHCLELDLLVSHPSSRHRLEPPTISSSRHCLGLEGGAAPPQLEALPRGGDEASSRHCLELDLRLPLSSEVVTPGPRA